MEQYEVRFWIQKPDGYWEQRKKIYRSPGRSDHEKVEEMWKEEYPKGKLVSIIYI